MAPDPASRVVPAGPLPLDALGLAPQLLPDTGAGTRVSIIR